MKANSDSAMRKQIKSIENSRILTKQNITSKIFRSWAKKAEIPEDVYSIGCLVFPKNTRKHVRYFCHFRMMIFSRVT